MRGAMGLEPLPVVGKLPREEDLSLDSPRAWIRDADAGTVELGPLGGSQLGLEGLVEIGKEIRGKHGEFVAVGAVVAFRSGSVLALAELDEQVERRHLHGFLDALGQLSVDPLAKTSRIAGTVPEAGGAEGIVHHPSGNMRFSPIASGSGASLKSS